MLGPVPPEVPLRCSGVWCQCHEVSVAVTFFRPGEEGPARVVGGFLPSVPPPSSVRSKTKQAALPGCGFLPQATKFISKEKFLSAQC